MCRVRRCARLRSCGEAEAQRTASRAAGVRAPAGSSGATPAAATQTDKAHARDEAGRRLRRPETRCRARCTCAAQRSPQPATKPRCVARATAALSRCVASRCAGGSSRGRAPRSARAAVRAARHHPRGAAASGRAGRAAYSASVARSQRGSVACGARSARQAASQRHAASPRAPGHRRRATREGRAAAGACVRHKFPRPHRASAGGNDASRPSRFALPRPWQPLLRFRRLRGARAVLRALRLPARGCLAGARQGRAGAWRLRACAACACGRPRRPSRGWAACWWLRWLVSPSRCFCRRFLQLYSPRRRRSSRGAALAPGAERRVACPERAAGCTAGATACAARAAPAVWARAADKNARSPRAGQLHRRRPLSARPVAA